MAARRKRGRASKSVLVTGASRGLGLALARHYAAQGARVYACCRAPSKAKELARIARASGGRVTLHRLDVTRAATIARLARAFRGRSLDLLVNNAGIYGGHHGMDLKGTDYRLWARACATNVMGPARMAAAFAAALARSRRGIIANVSSILGSVALTTRGGSYAYRSTKAGLNMVTKALAAELAPKRIAVVAIHPGWVRTDMGGPKAPLTAEESAAKVAAVIARLKRRDSGAFLDREGKPMPW